MDKKIIDEVIFEKEYDGERHSFKVSDLPNDVLPTDEIVFYINEGYYSENNSYDSSTYLKVTRARIENDEEFEKRKLGYEKQKENNRKMRYESYLRLKKEFENGTT